MAKAARKKNAKSPYQKYGKVAYRYSETYYSWKAAVKAGRRDEAERLGRQHSVRFGVFSQQTNLAIAA